MLIQNKNEMDADELNNRSKLNLPQIVHEHTYQCRLSVYENNLSIVTLKWLSDATYPSPKISFTSAPPLLVLDRSEY